MRALLIKNTYLKIIFHYLILEYYLQITEINTIYICIKNKSKNFTNFYTFLFIVKMIIIIKIQKVATCLTTLHIFNTQ